MNLVPYLSAAFLKYGRTFNTTRRMLQVVFVLLGRANNAGESADPGDCGGTIMVALSRFTVTGFCQLCLAIIVVSCSAQPSRMPTVLDEV
jgi:hypothetical protein